MPRNILRAGLFTSVAVSMLAIAACTNATAPSQSPESSEPETLKEASSVTEQSIEPKYTNRLVDETSPYLLQHAHNPVDWYPWGEEALQKAKDENKPIFLSVGYSACHWCHVMEHECFEDEEVAALLNEHFIAIKVDREERPDIDEIYMAAVQAMTGQGGWPMSVFITPELKPFWGGTYFPKESKYGRPGFMTILSSIADSWKTKPDEIQASATQLTQHVTTMLSATIGGDQEPAPILITNAVAKLSASFDSVDGGFGQAPKFPASSSIAMILREYQRTGDAEQLKMATHSLDKMAQGGMYDHLGGGFARYATDDEWLVPHFEKMLYDNAQLAQVYLEAYQVTKDPFYKQVAEETFAYILRDMRDDRGGFHSAEDADSEGEEGKFYVWKKAEIDKHLGEADANIFNTYYNVRENGNFSSNEPYHENENILHTPISDEAVAKILKISLDELTEKMDSLNEKVLALRNTRVRPGLDDKVLTAWNALMITAFAQGYQILGNEAYRDAAVEAMDFLLTDMIEDGQLLRTHRKGVSHLPAYLDDYASTIVALLDVYEATFDVKWIQSAEKLTRTMIAKFWDESTNGFYYTSLDHKNLIVRTRTSQDNATPSGTSMATYGLLRLAKFTDHELYHDMARRILIDNQPYLDEHPTGFMKLMASVDFYLNPPKEIALVGTPGSPAVHDLLATVHSHFIPNKVVALGAPDDTSPYLPLLAHKTMVDNQATAYVCKNFTCKQPVTTPDALLNQLELNTGV